jgi:hypothetical protein
LKRKIGKVNSYEISNDNGVWAINFVT